jgi:segregation and condensation protein B
VSQDDQPTGSLADQAANWVPPWARPKPAADEEASGEAPGAGGSDLSPDAGSELSPDAGSELESGARPEAEAEVAVEPEPDATAEPESALESEARAETDAVDEPESQLESGARSEPASEAAVEFDALIEPEAESESESWSEFQAASEPRSEVAVESLIEPEAEVRSEPEPEAEVRSEPEPEAEVRPEPEAEVRPEPEPEVRSEPEAAVEPESGAGVEVEAEVLPEAELEPQAEHEADSEPGAEDRVASDVEAEPLVEGEAKADVEGEPLAGGEVSAADGPDELLTLEDLGGQGNADLPRSTDEPAVADEVRPEMSDVELRGAVEAILLIVDEPTTEMTMAQVLEQPVDRVRGVLEDISRQYTSLGLGFDLRRVAGGWRLYTRPEYAAYVEKFVLDGQQVRLTQAALETLAVVAYKQPVTRSRISAIRGVNCDGVVRTLVTRGLIEETGSEPESGAFLYRTTTLFLEKLGLDSVDQLPPLAPFLPDDIDEIADAQR